MTTRPAITEQDVVQTAMAGIIAALLVAFLALGSSFLIPLAVAAIIWFSIDALAHFIQRARIGGRHPPWWLSLTLAIASTLAALILIGDLVGNNVREVVDAAPRYQRNLEQLLTEAYGLVGLQPPGDIRQLIASFNIAALLGDLAGALTGLVGQAGIVLVYVGFLLVEQGRFDSKLTALFPDPARRERMIALFARIADRTRTYIAVKAVVSLLTGAISYGVLRLVGVDFAAFWGLVIFLLNFIPTIGSIIGVVFPALLTLMQFDTLTPFLIVAIGLGITQFVIGNIIEPAMMGESLNLSPLVVILALFVWGAMWGVVGLFLGVPLTVVLVIILAHFRRTRWVAILLSTDGHIVDEEAERSEALNHKGQETARPA